jgi:hypothetical protein
MPRVKKAPIDKTGQIINFYEHVPKKYLDEVENPNFNQHNFDFNLSHQEPMNKEKK